jgi:chemotaxis protein MotA
MDKATLIGIILGVVFILLGIGAGLPLFIDIPSIQIVMGGTIAAVMIGARMEDLKKFGKITKKIFNEENFDKVTIIKTLSSFGEKARKEGLLALEDDIEKLDDKFFQEGMKLVVDGIDGELVRTILDTEMAFLEKRHSLGKALYDSVATFAPAFGMIGTLIGLIKMLANLSDPNALGPGMAVALITTFYGAVISNFLIIPMSTKLANKSNAELICREIVLEGILSIQSGDNPRIVTQRLKVFLSPEERLLVDSEDKGEE